MNEMDFPPTGDPVADDAWRRFCAHMLKYPDAIWTKALINEAGLVLVSPQEPLRLEHLYYQTAEVREVMVRILTATQFAPAAVLTEAVEQRAIKLLYSMRGTIGHWGGRVTFSSPGGHPDPDRAAAELAGFRMMVDQNPYLDFTQATADPARGVQLYVPEWCRDAKTGWRPFGACRIGHQPEVTACAAQIISEAGFGPPHFIGKILTDYAGGIHMQKHWH